MILCTRGAWPWRSGAYLSQYCLYLALRGYFPVKQRSLVLAGACLIPSGVFWSSAMIKEGIIMTALGPLVLALHWIVSGRRRILGIVIVLYCSMILTFIKPYVLMALSISASIFYLRLRFKTALPEFKPFAVISSLFLAIGGLTIGAQYLGRDSAESSAAVLAQQRRAGYGNQGGSDYFLDNRNAIDDASDRTLAQELLLAPIALGTAFFRPFVFEARNAVQFANSLEATLLLILFVQMIRRWGWAGSLRETMRSPALAFCAAFAFALGLGTGLASSNLGTLSRYRAPMMPFFFILLLVLRYGAASPPETSAPPDFEPERLNTPETRGEMGNAGATV